MKNLIYKEFKLSIHPFFVTFPVLLAMLFFVPQWLYIVIFMYFIWVTIPNVVSNFNGNHDYLFMSVLPVSKKDIVSSKVYSFVVLQLIHFGVGAIMLIVHNLIYGSHLWVFVDTTPIFLGYVLLMYSLVNIIFFPKYFKTAFSYGKPLILTSVVTLLFGAAVELGTYYIDFVGDFVDRSSTIIQYLTLIGCALVYIIVNYVTIKISTKNYENAN